MKRIRTESTRQRRQRNETVHGSGQDQYHLDLETLEPRVYYRITDNWLELSLRFLSHDRSTRELKDRIARAILQGFDEAGIGIASTTIDIVAFPPVRRETRAAGEARAADSE